VVVNIISFFGVKLHNTLILLKKQIFQIAHLFPRRTAHLCLAVLDSSGMDGNMIPP